MLPTIVRGDPVEPGVGFPIRCIRPAAFGTSPWTARRHPAEKLDRAAYQGESTPHARDRPQRVTVVAHDVEYINEERDHTRKTEELFAQPRATTRPLQYSRRTMRITASSDIIVMELAMTASPFLTEAAAAKYLGLAPATLSRWRSVGAPGPAYRKFGGAVRYAMVDLDAYASAAEVRP